MRLNCTSYGAPPPSITWYHNEASLPARAHVSTVISTLDSLTQLPAYTSTLTIGNVSFADRGQYSCRSVINTTVAVGDVACSNMVNASSQVDVYGR